MKQLRLLWLLVILVSVDRSYGAFLDVVPTGPVTEGDRIEVTCSEIFAYGISSYTNITLEQNSTNLPQYVVWNLTSNQVNFSSNWILTRNIKTSAKLQTIYMLKFSFYASSHHNKMTMKCLSTRVYQGPSVTFHVRKPPEVMSCIANPSVLISKTPVIVKCWLMLGMPTANDIQLKAQNSRSQNEVIEHETNSRFSYRIVRRRWTLRIMNYNKSVKITVKTKNIYGGDSLKMVLHPKRNEESDIPIDDEPNVRLMIEPIVGDTTKLHAGDKVRCFTENSVRQWDIKLFAKTTEDIESVLLASSNGKNELQISVPDTYITKLVKFHCIASTKFASNLSSQITQGYVFPANHRTFLSMKSYGTSFKKNKNAIAECYFLPINLDGNITMSLINAGKIKYESTCDSLSCFTMINRYSTGRVALKCTVNSNLYFCSLELKRLETDDTNTIFQCKTETNRRVDVQEKKITVESPPEVRLLAPPTFIVPENETVTITCLIRLGNPPADKRNLVLKFENTTAKGNRKDDAPMNDANGFQWQVLRITKRIVISDQSKNLICSAKNAIGETIKSASITMPQTVNGLKISPPPNTPLKRSQVFTCSASGHPPPRIHIEARYGPQMSLIQTVSGRTRASIRPYNYSPDVNISITCRASQLFGVEIKRISKTVKYSPN